jgi:NAD-dependent dihydropyrimidine dehydrogenase PreA subunit
MTYYALNRALEQLGKQAGDGKVYDRQTYDGQVYDTQAYDGVTYDEQPYNRLAYDEQVQGEQTTSNGQAHDRQVHDELACDGQLQEEQAHDGHLYNRQAYDRLTYNEQACSGQTHDVLACDGQVKSEQARDGQTYDKQLYDRQGYDEQSYDGQTYDEEIYDGQTYDRQPYARQAQDTLPTSNTEESFRRNEVIVTGDIGCTILGIHAPLNVCWTEVSMGASIGIAQGFKYAGIEKPVIAAMGDGTFYHNGIAGLLNAVQSGVNLTLLILDNSTSAMTGLQPDAGSGKRATGEASAQANIALIVQGCGVTYVKELNPYHLSDMIETLQEAISYPGVAVVIAKAPCTTPGVLINEYPIQVNQDKCRAGNECHDTPCYTQVGCPSVLIQRDDIKQRVTIDSTTCVSCGLCVAACPFEAILPIQE